MMSLHYRLLHCTGDNEIKPSLLHGDLWSGNIGSADGKPSIFDPAVYWGHHEAEWGVSIHLSIFCVVYSVGMLFLLRRMSMLIIC